MHMLYELEEKSANVASPDSFMIKLRICNYAVVRIGMCEEV